MKLSNFSSNLLIALSLVLGATTAEARNAVKVVYVRSEKAYVWSKPGFTWRDCDKFSANPVIKGKSNDFSDMSQLLEAKEVCANGRFPSLSEEANALDEIYLQPDGKGGYINVEKDVLVGNQLEKRKFYEVVYDQYDEDHKPVRDKNGKQKSFRGWMPEENLTQIETDEFKEEPLPTPLDEKPFPKNIEPPCPPENKGKPAARNEPVKLKKTAKKMSELANNANSQTPVSSVDKSASDVNRFACLYRDASVTDAAFPAHLAKVSAAAAQASASFGVPYSTLMCTLLIESGMSYKPHDRDAYQGMGQFGSDMVTDLKGIAKRDPYSNNLASYKKKYPHTEFSDRNIRQANGDPAHVVAATAMTMNWIYRERLKDPRYGKCNECSVDNKMTRRELYLMIAGYNYGPYGLKRYSNRPLNDMMTSYPPPEETRNYMRQMDRCMQNGQETQFRVNGRTVSSEYKNRKPFCDSKYPTKVAVH